MASLPQEVVLFSGGPAENPIGNTFVPFSTSTLLESTVTTEPWALAVAVLITIEIANTQRRSHPEISE